jgi:serine/threonine protein kinase
MRHVSRVCRLCCSGSFAVVKKGIRKTDGAQFAVKYIDKTSLKADDEAMLESECAVLKEVNHPNVVRLFEIYYTQDQLILVMEFVDGGEMLEKLKQAERYNETDAANTVHKIVEALVYIHAKGIAHRDLKPENLLLTHGDEAVKVVDFGFAKMMKSEQDMLQTACGKLHTLSQETLTAAYLHSKQQTARHAVH